LTVRPGKLSGVQFQTPVGNLSAQVECDELEVSVS